jgi:hypothetical protein
MAIKENTAKISRHPHVSSQYNFKANEIRLTKTQTVGRVSFLPFKLIMIMEPQIIEVLGGLVSNNVRISHYAV